MNDKWVDPIIKSIDRLTHVIIDHHYLNEFFEDEDHGISHGLMVAYWALQYGEEDELTILGCLCHDIARFTHGDLNHDQNLIKVIDYLPATVYEHTNPTEVTNLVRADRLDLIRFDNANHWVKPEMVPEILEVDFYRSLRTKIIESPEFTDLTVYFMDNLIESRIS